MKALEDARSRLTTLSGLLVLGPLLAVLWAKPAGVDTRPGSEPHAGSSGAAGERHAVPSRLPLLFEINQGQFDGHVEFVARGHGYALYLTTGEVVLALRSSKPPRDAVPGDQPAGGRRGPGSARRESVLRMAFDAASSAPTVTGIDRLPSRSNYLLGGDPSAWHTNVAHFARVRYEALYPGIDLVFYGDEGRLEYDFVLAPRADPDRIRLRFEGAESMFVDASGDLVLRLGEEEVVHRAPFAYQAGGGSRRAVPSAYRITGPREVGFAIGAYDDDDALIVDPVLSFSTYLGGSAFDTANEVAVDGAGNAYVVGTTQSIDFPTSSAFQTDLDSMSQQDAFVGKLNAAGTALLYSTYLGGGASEQGLGVAVDRQGNAYLTGLTASTDYPLQGAAQDTYGGGFSDAFVTKLDGGGGLVYSTYLGGALGDPGHSIAVDAQGNAYVTGITLSTDYPTESPLQGVSGGGAEAFVTKLDPTGSSLVFSTYLGGVGTDHGIAIALDAAANAYITGATDSTDFPTESSVQGASGGASDAFVAKLSSGGSALAYSTYLGGGGADRGAGIAVDAAGNVYVTGETPSTDFPTQNALQGAHGGGFNDAFVTKLSAGGLAYSTFLGGGDADEGSSVGVGASGNAYVTGNTFSTDFPTRNAIQGSAGGSVDAFVTELDAAGASIVSSTYLGGSDSDRGNDIAVTDTDAFIAGSTSSADFPTASALDPSCGTDGDCNPIPDGPGFEPVSDGFVAKLSTALRFFLAVRGIEIQ